MWSDCSSPNPTQAKGGLEWGTTHRIFSLDNAFLLIEGAAPFVGHEFQAAASFLGATPRSLASARYVERTFRRWKFSISGLIRDAGLKRETTKRLSSLMVSIAAVSLRPRRNASSTSLSNHQR